MNKQRIFAGLLASALLLSGCSGSKEPETINTSEAFSALTQGLETWNSAQARYIGISGSILAEYNDSPSAVQFSGMYQNKAADNGDEVYSLLTFRYGDDYYYNYYYMSDGERYVAAVEGGSSSSSSTDSSDSVYTSEELDADTFASFTGYARSELVFDESQISAVTMETDKESGVDTYHFTLNPSTCADEAIALLEQFQYIDTTTAEITCEVASMSFDASFSDESLQSISYTVNCDLTCEGEVLTNSFRFSHTLNGLNDEVDFSVPDLDAVLEST